MDEKRAVSREDLLHLTSLREVFGGFAHEIAQPLNAIMIAAQVIQLRLDRNPLPDAEKFFLVQRLELISSQVQRVSKIVGNVRGFGQDGSSESETPTNPAMVFNHVYGMMGQQFVGRGIEFTVEEEAPDLRPTGMPRSVVENSVVQMLAYARDMVRHVEAQYTARQETFKKAVRARLVNGDSGPTLVLWWESGHALDGLEFPDPAERPGLAAAKELIQSAGGSLSVEGTSVAMVLPPYAD